MFRSNEFWVDWTSGALTLFEVPFDIVRFGSVSSETSSNALSVPAYSGWYCKKKAGPPCEKSMLDVMSALVVSDVAPAGDSAGHARENGGNICQTNAATSPVCRGAIPEKLKLI